MCVCVCVCVFVCVCIYSFTHTTHTTHRWRHPSQRIWRRQFDVAAWTPHRTPPAHAPFAGESNSSARAQHTLSYKHTSHCCCCWRIHCGVEVTELSLSLSGVGNDSAHLYSQTYSSIQTLFRLERWPGKRQTRPTTEGNETYYRGKRNLL